MSLNLYLSGRTLLLGVVGSPVSHSLSPLIHNYVIQKRNQDFVYLPFDVLEEGIEDWYNSFRLTRNFRGVNVTIPFKCRLFHCVDKVTSMAHQVGAINVLKKEGDSIVGDNTDVYGVLYSLSFSSFQGLIQNTSLKFGESPLLGSSLVSMVSGQTLTCFLLGCGGASRSVCVALGLLQRQLSCSVRIVCLHRKQSKEKAQQLARDIESFFPELQFVFENCMEIDYSSFFDSSFYLFVNASSLGLNSQDPFPFDISKLPDSILAHSSFFDLVYHRDQTPFVRFLLAHKQRACDGLDMLLMQAAVSFSLWTDEDVASVFLDMKESLLK